MRNIFDKVKDFLVYDADREFYAKIFPESVDASDLLRFRKMRMDDIPAILAIEKQVYNYPWSEGIFKDCMRIGYSCLVCDGIDGVIGYGILTFAANEAHIMNVCVSPDEQGQGYGRRMIEQLIEVARSTEADSVFLEVRPSNEAAIALYEKMGFNEIGIRKDYYPAHKGTREDALMFGLELV
jgi:[ribosomal protein S18]-alanine N-acetyltransferase